MHAREEVVSTNKIIFMVVFVCAALITSLFVFNLSHRPAPSALPAEQGLLFPAPRDINKFELMTTDGKPFTENDLRNHWTLLFFGFTHCGSVCPATLDVMQRAYKTLKDTQPGLQVILVSLDPVRDNAATLSRYVHSFNADFIGVSGKQETLRKMQSQFGVYSAREEGSGNNYQLQHTASVFLINPNGKWAGLFNYGLKPEQLVSAVKMGMSVMPAQAGIQ